ncbi:hypothetical protein ACFO6R_00520 [Eubacterium multiforme]|uniref:Membrane-associated HD superfamily phosphohydrolase n=1 Tax=Eubacterium multiforme TaxID=83339 RepID=A0ABT9UQ53_9FIRM|nr:hypothetical protein [Eubacterium multiforme]MDQ0148775.1 membrane-associated HD superfamily phosphohydrolase [Eubacterium multiforme]
MNKYIQKIISLSLIVLILLLTLNHFKIIELSKILKESFSFITLILIIISSVSVLNGKKAGIYKFINYIILITAILGGIFVIINSKLNLSVYVCILFTLTYALIDMLYKKA